jgi:apolipoprotein N-acyltransferase
MITRLTNFAIILNPLNRIGDSFYLLRFVFLGACFAMGAAPFNLLPISYLAFIIYLRWVLFSSSSRTVFKYSFIFSFTYFSIASNWIAQAFVLAMPDSAWALPVGIIGMTTVTGFMALMTAASMALAVRCNRHIFSKWGKALCVGLFWVVGELLRSNLMGGWPMNSFAYIFIDMTYLIQIISVIGFFPFTVLIVTASGFIAYLGRWLAVGCLLIMLVALFGVIKLEVLAPSKSSETLNVRLVNGSFSQQDLKNLQTGFAVANNLIELTNSRDSEFKPDLIVWPESALKIMVASSERASENRHYLTAFMSSDQKLIAGGIRSIIDREAKRFRTLNSMFLMDGNGELIGTFDKQQLVPLGEFVPFRRYLPDGFTDLFASIDVKKGEGERVLNYAKNFNIFPMVCAESHFPQLLTFHQTDHKMIVVIGSESWFESSSAPEQYLTGARFRALEAGLPLVSASNKGYLAIIDSNGRIVKALFSGEPEVLDGVVEFFY